MFKRFSIFLLACIAILAVAVCSISPTRYNQFIEQKVISLARTAGIPLVLEGFSFGIPSLSASRLQATIQTNKLPVVIAADTVRITPTWLSLFSRQRQVGVDALLYGGTLSSTFGISPDEGQLQLAVDLTDADLASHPQIAGFGLVGGTLSLHTENVQLSEHMPPAGLFTVTLQDARTAGEIILPPHITGLPLPLRLPTLADGTLTARVNLSGERIFLESIESTSSWGTFTGKGNFVLDEHNRIRAFSVEGTVALSDAGLTNFGSYLPLLTSNRVSAQQKTFAFTVAGPPVRIIAAPEQEQNSASGPVHPLVAQTGAGANAEIPLGSVSDARNSNREKS